VYSTITEAPNQTPTLPVVLGTLAFAQTLSESKKLQVSDFCSSSSL